MKRAMVIRIRSLFGSLGVSSNRNRLNKALPGFPCPDEAELTPFLGCRRRSGWRGRKKRSNGGGWRYHRCWPDGKTEILAKGM